MRERACEGAKRKVFAAPVWLGAPVLCVAMVAVGCNDLSSDCKPNLNCGGSGAGAAGGGTTTSTTGGGGSTTSATAEGGSTTSTTAEGGSTTGGTTMTSECEPNAKRCSGNTPQTCDSSGQWQDEAACSVEAPVCTAGTCVLPASCNNLPANCGPGGNESCCAVGTVQGGTFNRSNDPMYPATVADFVLDRFEITVGRFRKFVNAYPGSKPMQDGVGAHPLIVGSGWNPAWAADLLADKAAIESALACGAPNKTWTSDASGNETLPINCITWFEAFAFCAWDGGRLPTEAEWNYAAAGGSEQREYPWSNPPSSTTIDGTHAVYNCLGDGSAAGDCSAADILGVGSKSPKGDAKWGQADLGGSLWEWNLDWYDNPYPKPCNNCANLTTASTRVGRGGSWGGSASGLLSSKRFSDYPPGRSGSFGARCARTP